MLGGEASKSANTAPGLRLNGTYSLAGGLKIEFRHDSATLECGAALSSEGYGVVPEGQLVVKFRHSAGPLSLVLQPNGTLNGTGSVDNRQLRPSRGLVRSRTQINCRDVLLNQTVERNQVAGTNLFPLGNQWRGPLA